MTEFTTEERALLIQLIDEQITELKRREQFLKTLRVKLSWVSDLNSVNT
jgi:hypothetical protein